MYAQLIDKFINAVAELYLVDSKAFIKVCLFKYLSYKAVSAFIKRLITSIHFYSNLKTADLATPYKYNIECLNSLRLLRR
jgi:hypothetical protein